MIINKLNHDYYNILMPYNKNYIIISRARGPPVAEARGNKSNV